MAPLYGIVAGTGSGLWNHRKAHGYKIVRVRICYPTFINIPRDSMHSFPPWILIRNVVGKAVGGDGLL
jgi:hypothetical protein